MNDLTIHLDADQHAFAPGDVIAGEATWQLDKHPRSIAIRFLWATSGRAAPTAAIVEEITLKDPLANGEHRFKFTAPAGPNSFTGKLTALDWYIEVTIKPGSHSARQELIIARDRKKIELHASRS